ncbi:MAG: glycosyltransferase [Candidatus Omnitrophota bacterium]|jgi:hypothetical protein
MAPKFEIVFPAYNEAKRLKEFRTVEKYDEYFAKRCAPGDYSILVVINGSTDGTAEAVRDTAKGSGRVRYIEIPEKGKGFALIEGLKHVTAPLMVFADIDGSAGPEQAEKLLNLAQGQDIVAGSRRMPGFRITFRPPLARRVNSALASFAVRLFTGLPVRDPFCGLKVFRTEQLKKILPSCKAGGSLIDVEALSAARRAGMAIKEVPIEWGYTPGSKASIVTSDMRNLPGLIRIGFRISPVRAALLFLLLLNLADFINYSLTAARYPYSINIVEGAMWASGFWSRSIGYYPDCSQWPYWPTAYPPLFYIVAGWMHRITGLGLEAGRIISLLSAAGISVLIAMNAAKRNAGRFWAAVFFMAFLSIHGVAYWGNLYRVDMLEAFFVCLALYIGLDGRVSAPKMAASSALLSLAFFTKSTVVIPAAVLFFYWFAGDRAGNKRKRPALTAVLLFAALTSAVFFSWQAATAGQFAFQVFGIMLRFTEFKLSLGIGLLKCFIRETWPLLIAVALSFRYYRGLTGPEKTRVLFLSAGLAGSIAFILAAGSRIGSDTNYLIEAYIWLLLLAGSLVSAPSVSAAGKSAATVLFLLFALINLLPQPGAKPPFREEKKAKDIAVQLAADTDKFVISEDASIAILAGKGPVFEPYIMDRLWMLGLWDPSRFISGIDSGIYSLVYADKIWNCTKYIDSPLNRYYNKISIK